MHFSVVSILMLLAGQGVLAVPAVEEVRAVRTKPESLAAAVRSKSSLSVKVADGTRRQSVKAADGTRRQSVKAADGTRRQSVKAASGKKVQSDKAAVRNRPLPVTVAGGKKAQSGDNSKPQDRAPTEHQKSLAPALWLNGRPLTRSGSGRSSGRSNVRRADPAPCGKGDDVLECAWKFQKTFRPNPETHLGTRQIHVPTRYYGEEFLLKGRSGYMILEYDTTLSNCEVGPPKIVHKEPLVFCNTNMCKEILRFVKTKTKSVTFGFRIGTSALTRNGVTPLSVNLGISGEWDHAWTRTETNTEDMSREYTMTEGQFCSAATIQMDVHCYGVITTATKDVEWIGETFGKNNPRIIKDFCGTKEASLEKYRSEEVNAVCESLRTKTPITVDLQSQPFEDPWVMEGCMYA